MRATLSESSLRQIVRRILLEAGRAENFLQKYTAEQINLPANRAPVIGLLNLIFFNDTSGDGQLKQQDVELYGTTYNSLIRKLDNGTLTGNDLSLYFNLYLNRIYPKFISVKMETGESIDRMPVDMLLLYMPQLMARQGLPADIPALVTYMGKAIRSELTIVPADAATKPEYTEYYEPGKELKFEPIEATDATTRETIAELEQALQMLPVTGALIEALDVLKRDAIDPIREDAETIYGAVTTEFFFDTFEPEELIVVSEKLLSRYGMLFATQTGVKSRVAQSRATLLTANKLTSVRGEARTKASISFLVTNVGLATILPIISRIGELPIIRSTERRAAKLSNRLEAVEAKAKKLRSEKYGKEKAEAAESKIKDIRQQIDSNRRQAREKIQASKNLEDLAKSLGDPTGANVTYLESQFITQWNKYQQDVAKIDRLAQGADKAAAQAALPTEFNVTKPDGSTQTYTKQDFEKIVKNIEEKIGKARSFEVAYGGPGNLAAEKARLEQDLDLELEAIKTSADVEEKIVRGLIAKLDEQITNLQAKPGFKFWQNDKSIAQAVKNLRTLGPLSAASALIVYSIISALILSVADAYETWVMSLDEIDQFILSALIDTVSRELAGAESQFTENMIEIPDNDVSLLAKAFFTSGEFERGRELSGLERSVLTKYDSLARSLSEFSEALSAGSATETELNTKAKNLNDALLKVKSASLTADDLKALLAQSAERERRINVKKPEIQIDITRGDIRESRARDKQRLLRSQIGTRRR